jgi:hypothetical protein
MGAIQKYMLHLNLLTRTVAGGLIGTVTAGLWALVIGIDFSAQMNWFIKGVTCMVAGSGIVSGILGGPLNKEA